MRLTFSVGMGLLFSVLLLVGTVGATRLGSGEVQIPAMSYKLQLGKPHSAAQMTPQEAVQAAEAVWGPNLFTHYRYTVQYGAYHSNTMLRTPNGLQPVGTVDAWVITVTGLDVPRPAAEVAGPDGSLRAVVGPNIHTQVIVVDDKAGKYLEGVEY